MKNIDKTREQLLKELEKAKERVAELEKSETLHKKAGGALKESYENFQQVVSSITTVIWKADIGKNGTFKNTYSSPVLDELLELPAGTMQNDWNKFFNYIKPEYLEQVNTSFREAIISPGKEIDCEYEVLKDNGQTAWFHSKGRCFEKNGKLHVFGSSIDITERKQAEKEMIQKNEQLVLVMQGANIGWWDWDIPSGKEIYNKILSELLGYKYSEIEPNIKWWEDKIHPDDLKQVSIDLQEHFDGKTKFYVNKHRLKTRTGKWKWFFHHGKVVSRDKDGKPVRMIGTIRDIDNQRRAEEALRESEKQLQTLIDAMPDFVCFKDADGHWLKANSAGIRIFQLEGMDYRGKKDSELVALNSNLQETFLICKESDARVWKDGSILHGEETIPDPNGSARFYDVVKVPIFYPGGERKGLVILGHDITERKHAGELLKKSEAQLRQVIDTVPHMIFAKDRDGRFIMANKAVADGCGITPENVIGKTHPELSGATPDQYESYLTDDREVIASGKLKFIPEENYTYPDGHSVVMETTKIPFTSTGIPAVLGVSIDITERKKTEEELKKYQEHLEELIKERTKELEDKNKRLEKFNKLFVGREFRIKELREKVKELEKKCQREK